jgi:hypothetical protein
MAQLSTSADLTRSEFHEQYINLTMNTTTHILLYLYNIYIYNLNLNYISYIYNSIGDVIASNLTSPQPHKWGFEESLGWSSEETCWRR